MVFLFVFSVTNIVMKKKDDQGTFQYQQIGSKSNQKKESGNVMWNRMTHGL